MTIKSSQTLVSEALKQIKTISTDEAHKMVDDNKCNLIDIRDIRELQKEGQVEGANHIPRGMLQGFRFHPGFDMCSIGFST